MTVSSVGGWTLASLALFGLISFLVWLGYGAYLLNTANVKEAVLPHIGLIVTGSAFFFALLAIPVYLGIPIIGRGGAVLPEEFVTKGLSTIWLSGAAAYCTLRVVRRWRLPK